MAKRIIISDESVNCYGTWVKTDGVDISQYERNPVLLWMHWRGIIIGCIKDIKRKAIKSPANLTLMKYAMKANLQSSNGIRVR